MFRQLSNDYLRRNLRLVNNQATKTPLWAWGILLILGVIWGSSYFLISKGLEGFDPLQLASLRLAVTFFAFLPVFLIRFKDIPWKKTGSLLVVGGLGSGVPAFLFATAQTHLSSSLTGVLGATAPLFTFLVGIFIFKAVFDKSRFLGVLIGLAGALAIIFLGNPGATGGEPVYVILVAMSTFLYALSANTIKAKLQDVHPMTLAAASYVIIGPLVGSLLFYSDFFAAMQTEPAAWSSFWYVIALALSSTVFASVIFFKLIQMTNAVFATMVAYLIPIVATIIGLFNHEPISWGHFLGLGLILVGVYLSRE